MSRILLLCSSVSQHAVKRFHAISLLKCSLVVRVNPSSSNRKSICAWLSQMGHSNKVPWTGDRDGQGDNVHDPRGSRRGSWVAAHHVSSGYRLILVQHISLLRVGWPWEGFPPPPLLVASLIWIHLLQSPATEIQRIFNFKSTLFWPVLKIIWDC